MVGPRQRPPITGSSDDDDEDSSKVTWDELGDIMHLARRASAGDVGGYAIDSTRTNLTATAAASAQHTSASAAAATSSQSSGTSELIIDNDTNVVNHDHGEQIFTPRQIQNRHTMPTKLNHSLRSQTSEGGENNITSSRSSRGDHNLRGSDTSWDDLQDEIATAMRQSMMVGGADYPNPNKGRAAGSFATKNTTTSNDNNYGSGDTHHNGNSSLSSPPSSPPRHTTTSNTNDGGSPGSIIGDGGNTTTTNNQTNPQGGGWNCPACTFLNENPCHLVCAICGTAKEVASGDDNNIDDKNGNTANNNEDEDDEPPSRSLSGRSTGTASEDSFAPARIKNGSFHSQHSKISASSRSSSRRKSVSNSSGSRQNSNSNEERPVVSVNDLC